MRKVEEDLDIAELLKGPRKSKAQTPRPVISDLLHSEDERDDRFLAELDQVQNQRRLRAARRVWRTEKGEEIAYSHLHILHVVHILIMLRRHAQAKVKAITAKDGFAPGPDGFRALKPQEWEVMLNELCSRGVRAAWAADLIDSPHAEPNEWLIRSFLKDNP
jgi:hypothetical protein